jgi:hypothetical protein
VPDQLTRELMKDFYRRLLGGQPRAEALCKAQLAMKQNILTYSTGAPSSVKASLLCCKCLALGRSDDPLRTRLYQAWYNADFSAGSAGYRVGRRELSILWDPGSSIQHQLCHSWRSKMLLTTEQVRRC